jgi:hypothetical protein
MNESFTFRTRQGFDSNWGIGISLAILPCEFAVSGYFPHKPHHFLQSLLGSLISRPLDRFGFIDAPFDCRMDRVIASPDSDLRQTVKETGEHSEVARVMAILRPLPTGPP